MLGSFSTCSQKIIWMSTIALRVIYVYVHCGEYYVHHQAKWMLSSFYLHKIHLWKCIDQLKYLLRRLLWAQQDDILQLVRFDIGWTQIVDEFEHVDDFSMQTNKHMVAHSICILYRDIVQLNWLVQQVAQGQRCIVLYLFWCGRLAYAFDQCSAACKKCMSFWRQLGDAKCLV